VRAGALGSIGARLREQGSVALVYAFGAIVLGMVLPRVESHFFPTWTHSMSVSSATAFLGAVASGMMALTGIVFSLAFVMVQFSATAYSPRLVLWLAGDPIIPHSIGVFTSTFLYALAALAWVGRTNADAVPFVSANVVLLLLIASVFMFARLVARVGMLQITQVLQSIEQRGRAVVLAMYPQLGDVEGGSQEEAAQVRAALPCSQTIRYSGPPMVIDRLDAIRLARIATEADAVIMTTLAVGDTAIEGIPILEIYGAKQNPSREAVLGCIAFSTNRSFEQDPKWAIRLLVDIAIKALSPAINDPTTAVQALDQIESLLRIISMRRLDVGIVRDAAGKVRFIMPVPDWDDLLILACEEIRYYGTSSVQVMRRLRALLSELARDVPPPRALVVRTYLARVDQAIGRIFGDAQERSDALQSDRQGLGMPHFEPEPPASTSP